MIGILLPSVWSVRNVVYGGVLSELDRAGVETRLFMRRVPDPGVDALPAEFAHATKCAPLLDPPGRSVRGKALLDGVIRSAFSRRHRLSSYPIYQRWYARDHSLPERIRTASVDLGGALVRGLGVLDQLCTLTETMYRRSHDLDEVRAQLRVARPAIIWSTFCVSALEQPYILAARDLGIPVVTSILSFDNLTSRGWLPEFDHYLVWNAGMRDRLLDLYPRILPDRVSITGTPQFDFHRRAEFMWKRSTTLRRLDLPSDARYLLYSTSAEILTPEEPELVAQLAAMMERSERLRDHWLVVRLHPLDDGRRWARATAHGARVRISSAWDEWPEADGWTLSSSGDQARLVSTIAHSDACVNVASTMSLDAAILDRPVVNIDFSTERYAPRGLLYEEYGADHYRPLVESGGVRVAHGWAELEALLVQAIDDPGRDRERRARMVARECGAVDGHAAQRVTRVLLDLLDRHVDGTAVACTSCADMVEASVASGRIIDREGRAAADSRRPSYDGDITAGIE